MFNRCIFLQNFIVYHFLLKQLFQKYFKYRYLMEIIKYNTENIYIILNNFFPNNVKKIRQYL